MNKIVKTILLEIINAIILAYFYLVTPYGPIVLGLFISSIIAGIIAYISIREAGYDIDL